MSVAHALRWGVSDTHTMVRRYVIGLTKTPEVLFFTTVQPVLFVLLFAGVFGGSIDAPGGNYAEYLMPGVFVQTAAFAIAVTGSAVALDVRRGVVDRFRSLPMAPTAVLAGRAVADLLLTTVSLAVLSGFGLLVGWQPHAGFPQVIAAYLVLLAFAFAVTWLGVYVGLVVRAPEVASQASLFTVIPLVFLSNLYVPIDTLPGWVRPLAAWNPVSALVSTVRDLFGNSDRHIAESFPGRYPELVALISIGLLLAVFVPLSVAKFHRADR
ncbi:ABC transporter permease [Actinokineospora diospyrosa]|uniref:Transport permease protein n=1 Tax=Actinokineospora diospyrosa TaxID=103728 RepID=A0ABT1I9U4_9PSEU|nr:ABC transporter permease [Actinokineospora diospyrosa]MCP2269395.1 ABC-2 type transport system permease protein [Actinokineospora diospyrosa]